MVSGIVYEMASPDQIGSQAHDPTVACDTKRHGCLSGSHAGPGLAALAVWGRGPGISVAGQGRAAAVDASGPRCWSRAALGLLQRALGKGAPIRPADS